jgi:GTP pyrophosphokinase
MQTARDALRVYAPLAQRMGMQRLKSQIENTAFRILYPRQYDVSSALHDRDLKEMQTIIKLVSSRIEQLLMSDEVFMANIDNVSVSSRVKEPYSLWKKILRYRKEAVNASVNDSRYSASTSKSTFMPPTLSTKWVPDAIALRVIIRGKQMPLEEEESLRTREKMLCYFALQLIGDVWPASKANFAKDYIANPKGNGYQSLHYTAALVINGEEWPFEVQVCFS